MAAATNSVAQETKYGKCRVCHNNLSSNYRTLYSNTVEQQKQVLTAVIGPYSRDDGQPQKICLHCLNRVRRLGKIQDTIAKNFQSLRHDEEDLFLQLRTAHGGTLNTEKKTPVRHGKRKFAFTPTPKKSVKKLFKSGVTPPTTPSRITVKQPVPKPREQRSTATQTTSEKDFLVKVSFSCILLS